MSVRSWVFGAVQSAVAGGLFLLAVTPAQAQIIPRAESYGWLNITQGECVTRAERALAASKARFSLAMPQTTQGGTVVVESPTFHAGIHCIADDGMSDKTASREAQRVEVTVIVDSQRVANPQDAAIRDFLTACMKQNACGNAPAAPVAQAAPPAPVAQAAAPTPPTPPAVAIPTPRPAVAAAAPAATESVAPPPPADAPLVMAGPDYRPLLLARPFDWIDNRKVIGTIRFSDNGAARMAWNNAGATWRAEANGDLVVSAGDKTTRLKYDPQSYTFSDGQTLLRPQ